MKKAKGIFKTLFVGLVILGLISSYVFFKTPKPTTGYQGPTEAPSVEGPTGPPPTSE